MILVMSNVQAAKWSVISVVTDRLAGCVYVQRIARFCNE